MTEILKKYNDLCTELSLLENCNTEEQKKIKNSLYNHLKSFIKETDNKIILNALIPSIKLNYRNYKRYRLLNYIKYKLYKIKLKEKAFRRKNKGRGKMLLNTVEVLQVGKYTYCTTQPRISDVINTTIGSFCSFAADVKLGAGSHPLKDISTSPYLYLNSLGFKDNNNEINPEVSSPPPTQTHSYR